MALVRRLCEAIRRDTGSTDEVASGAGNLLESLPQWLAIASAHAGKEDKHWILAVDALNGLTGLRDLRWFPEFLPERVHFVISCLPGDVHDALGRKGAWEHVTVEPLTARERERLLVDYLGHYNKTLSPELLGKVLAHPLAENPLFLRTLAEELRLFGVHEQLAERIGHYLESRTVDDLFERVLERVEKDCGETAVRTAMEAIFASRAGLTEEEILGITGLVPATWAPIRYALDDALLESGGRLTFAHDYLRIGVSDRYMAGNNELAADGQSEEALSLRRAVHRRLAQWFQTRPEDTRTAEELPYQWRAARDWDELKACLTEILMFAVMIRYRGELELLGYWLDLEREADANIAAEYEAAWAQWELDETTIETGGIAAFLAQFLFTAGHCDEFPEKLVRISIEVNERVWGLESTSTTFGLDLLGQMYLAKNDCTVAEQLFRRALAINEKAYGAESTQTGVALNNLAQLLKYMEDYAAAEPLYHRALAISEKAEGPEHVSTAISLNNLASWLCEAKGDSASAEPLFRRALTITEKALGLDHPTTATRLQNLGGLLMVECDYISSEPLLRRALAIREKISGPEHPDTGSSLSALGALLMVKGDPVSAEPLIRRALAINEMRHGLTHFETRSTINSLAMVLEDMSEHAAAERLYRRVLATAETAQGPEFSDNKLFLRNLKSLLMKLGRNPDPELLLSRGDFVSIIRSAKAIAIENHQELLTPILVLAGALRSSQTDRIWGDEIANLLSEQLKQDILRNAKAKKLKIDKISDFADHSLQLPLSPELKSVLNKCMRTPMQEFIDALAIEGGA